MIKLQVALFAPLMVSCLYAQPEPAQVSSLTPDAPVAITGTITCSERISSSEPKDTASGRLDFASTSERGIVALEAMVAVRCRHDSESIRYHFDDLFFKANGLSPGDSITKAIPELEGSMVPYSPLVESPRVEVKIELVEFVDGSVWGDSTMMDAVRVRRRNRESQLGRLSSASSDGEFDSILNEMLAKPEDPFAYSMAYKISMVRKESAQAALADVRDRLRVAENREASGKF
jgi:hypothetical protein